MDFLDLDYYSEAAMLDQVLDHELDALIKVLQHNLNINGHPIDDGFSDRTDCISYVDCMGNSYLTNCLGISPS